MTDTTSKQASGSTVRIWTEAKEQLVEMVETRTEKEGRPVSEAEIVSKAISALYKKDKRKLAQA